MESVKLKEGQYWILKYPSSYCSIIEIVTINSSLAPKFDDWTVRYNYYASYQSSQKFMNYSPDILVNSIIQAEGKQISKEKALALISLWNCDLQSSK